MRKNIKALAVTAVVGGVSVLTLGSAMPALGSSNSSVPVNEILPILSVAQSAADVVPAGVDLSQLGGVAEESVRSLGSDELANYWVGRVGDTQVCLIAQIPGGNGVTGSTCSSIPEFHQSGLGIIVGEGEESRSTEAYLMPDDVDLADLGAPASATAAARMSGAGNFVSSRPGAVDFVEAEMQRSDATGTFQFVPLAFDGEAE